MKRIALVITALLLLAMLAVACGGGTAEQPVEEAANEAAETVDNAANEAGEAVDNAANEAAETVDNAANDAGEAATEADCTAEDVWCVGLVTDVGRDRRQVVQPVGLGRRAAGGRGPGRGRGQLH